MDYEIEFLEDFRDGNILPGLQKAGSRIVVDEVTYAQIRRSAPTSVAKRGFVIPEPTLKCPKCGEIYPVKEEHICGKTKG